MRPPVPSAASAKKLLRPDDTMPPPLTRGAPLTTPSPTAPGAPAATASSNLGAAQRIGVHSVSPHPTLTSGSLAGDDENDVGDLAAMKAAHEKEYAATQQELASSKAQALQTAAAKSGAAGFGLSGASAALQGDVGRAQDRNATLTLADLRGKQNDENYAELQREVALNDAEESDDRDLNHDGLIAGHKVGVGGWGDGNPDNNQDNTPGPNGNNNPTDPNNPRHNDYVALQQSAGGTGTRDDEFGGIGGYGDDSQRVLDGLKADGITFTYVTTEFGAVNGERYIIAFGSDGKTYKFKVPGSGLGVVPNAAAEQKWFAKYEGKT